MAGRRATGFTLLEVLTATAILSGTILGTIRVMADTLSISRQAEQRLTAVLLAEAEVERIKAALYDDFAVDVSPWSTDLSQGFRVTRTLTPTGTYRMHVAVQVGYDSDGDGLLDAAEVLVSLDTSYADHR